MTSPTATPFFRGIAQTELPIRQYTGKSPMFFADARILPRRDLLHVLRPVLLLALGLVALTE